MQTKEFEKNVYRFLPNCVQNNMREQPFALNKNYTFCVQTLPSKRGKI